MKFLFQAHVTIHPTHFARYWIDINILPTTTICADTLQEALTQFQEFAERRGVAISNNAIQKRNRDPLYEDDAQGNPHQIGYMLCAKTDIEGKRIGVDVWVKIQKVEDINFPEEDL